MSHLDSLRSMLDEAGVAYEYGEDTESEPKFSWIRIEENGREAPPLNPGALFAVFTFSAEGKLREVGILA